MKQKILNALINSVLGAVASLITIYLGGQATDAIVTGSATSGALAYLNVWTGDITTKDKMFPLIITSIGAILTASAKSDNQRAIGAAVLVAGLNRSLGTLEA